MSNIIDLNEEREITALINKLGAVISSDPDCANRAKDFLYRDSSMKNSESLMVSVRMPKALIENIDECAREIAYNEKRRVTRSTLITEWMYAAIRSYEAGNAQSKTNPDDQAVA